MRRRWGAAAVLLGVLAVAELIVRLARAPGSVSGIARLEPMVWSGGRHLSLAFFLLLCLLCLSTTLPLALFRPGIAAVIICLGSLGSVTVFHILTLAGVIAQLAAGYRLGLSGSPIFGVGLGMPFLLLALNEPDSALTGGEVRRLTLVLASLLPMAIAAGLARRAGDDNREAAAARQVMAGTLLQHTVRGERTRIARELHDVVAHHISIIAVQAETARLTVPQLPAAGARQLLGIGDSARTALTEMRHLLGVLRDDDEPAAADDRQPQPSL